MSKATSTSPPLTVVPDTLFYNVGGSLFRHVEAIFVSQRSRRFVIPLGPTRTALTGRTDEQLAHQIAQNQDAVAAFEESYARHGRDLLAMLTSRVPQIAEDIAQQTWLKVYNSLSRGIGDMTNFRGWLWTIARNAATDWLRRRPSTGLESLPEASGDDPPLLDQLAYKERRAAVRKCLEELQTAKPEFAAAIVAFLDGHSARAAAERLGITRDNFAKRKQRGIEALRRCVESKLR